MEEIKTTLDQKEIEKMKIKVTEKYESNKEFYDKKYAQASQAEKNMYKNFTAWIFFYISTKE